MKRRTHLRDKVYSYKKQGYKIRVVRYKINKTTYHLGTNLYNRNITPISKLKGLYHDRWNVEESFKTIKTQLNGHIYKTKSINRVKQEIYQKIILINISKYMEYVSLIGSENDLTKCKLNFKNSLGITINHILYLLLYKGKKLNRRIIELLIIIADTLVRIIPDRHFKRTSKIKMTVWYFIRKRK